MNLLTPMRISKISVCLLAGLFGCDMHGGEIKEAGIPPRSIEHTEGDVCALSFNSECTQKTTHARNVYNGHDALHCFHEKNSELANASEISKTFISSVQSFIVDKYGNVESCSISSEAGNWRFLGHSDFKSEFYTVLLESSVTDEVLIRTYHPPDQFVDNIVSRSKLGIIGHLDIVEGGVNFSEYMLYSVKHNRIDIHIFQKQVLDEKHYSWSLSFDQLLIPIRPWYNNILLNIDRNQFIFFTEIDGEIFGQKIEIDSRGSVQSSEVIEVAFEKMGSATHSMNQYCFRNNHGYCLSF